MPREKKTWKDNKLCKYNHEVECSVVCKPCDKCGWNPAVAEQRKKELTQPPKGE